MATPEEARRELARRELARRQAQQPSALADLAKSAGAGLVRGVTGLAELPGMADDAVGAGLEWAFGERGEIPEGVQPGFADLLPGLGEVTGAVERNVTGRLHEPQTTLGEYAQTGGEFAPAILGGAGSLLRRGLTNVAAPAVGSEAAGQATEGTPLEPYARVAGAVAGGVAPASARRAVTPLPVSPERQAAVNTLRKEGVKPTAGQATGRTGLQYRESEMGGGKARRAMEQQADDFTAAVLQKAGINAKRATPEVLDNAFTRIGKQFDDLAARASLGVDDQLKGALDEIVDGYIDTSGVPAPAVKKAAERIVRDAKLKNGVLSGEAYKNIRSQIGKWLNTADGPTKQALRDIQGALDDALVRSAPADEVAAWQEVRRQYKNLIPIERAVTGAGGASGAISPARLRSALVTQNRRAYGRGKGDLADLARAGDEVLAPLPNSGTAGRMGARGVPGMVGAGGGASVAGYLSGGDPLMMSLGATAGAAAPKVAGRGLMSRPAQSYLGNQALAGGAGVDPRMLLLESILAGRSAAAQ